MMTVGRDVPEDAPLLGRDELQDEPLPSSAARPKPWLAKTPGTMILLMTIVKFGVTTSGMLILIPMYRLIEDVLCHAHYHDSSPGLIDEMRCKGDEVQSRLAFMVGWFGLFNSILTLLVSFPYGLLADRIGRKPMALMAYGGTTAACYFAALMLGRMQAQLRSNPYLLMTVSLFLLFGGGIPVLIATLYAMAADVSSEEEKATSFLYLSFGVTAGVLVGPLLGGLLMERYGPWAPIYVVLAISPAILGLIGLIPETLVVEAARQGPELGLGEHVAEGLRDLVRSVALVRDPNVLLVLVTFLFQNAKFVAYTSTLTQYLSKRFGWRLAETSLLLSPLGIVNLAVLLALSGVSRVLTSSPRLRLGTFGKDLLLAQASTVLILAGALLQGLSSDVGLFLLGLFVGALGFADAPLARAAVSHHVEPRLTSRLYALVSMTEALGSFLAGPALAWLFRQGLRWGGLWMGLPWLYIAFLSVVTLAVLLFVRPPRGSGRVCADMD